MSSRGEKLAGGGSTLTRLRTPRKGLGTQAILTPEVMPYRGPLCGMENLERSRGGWHWRPWMAFCYLALSQQWSLPGPSDVQLFGF